MAIRFNQSVGCQLPSQRVTRFVAAQLDATLLELPPLYDTIDPEALDALVDELDDGTIKFQYAGQFVTVHSDGSVAVIAEAENNVERPDPATEE